MKKGEILTLIGPNGAGKTTILRSIIRQLAPLGGVVWLDGKQTEKMSGRELSRKLSVVLTERIRPEMMTCEDVVATGRYPYTGTFGILTSEDRRIVRESMELVHILELKDRDFLEISDGQKQRVMLARASVSSRILSSWTNRRPFLISATSWNFCPSFRPWPEQKTFRF